MQPLVRRDFARLGEIDHVHRRRVAAFFSAPSARVILVTVPFEAPIDRVPCFDEWRGEDEKKSHRDRNNNVPE
jgi:hypothetical protein